MTIVREYMLYFVFLGGMLRHLFNYVAHGNDANPFEIAMSRQMFLLRNTPGANYTNPIIFHDNSSLHFSEVLESNDNAKKMSDVTVLMQSEAQKEHGFSLPVACIVICLFDALKWIPLLSTLPCFSRRRITFRIVLLEPP